MWYMRHSIKQNNGHSDFEPHWNIVDSNYVCAGLCMYNKKKQIRDNCNKLTPMLDSLFISTVWFVASHDVNGGYSCSTTKALENYNDILYGCQHCHS